MSLWDKQIDDFVWRRCSCGYRAEPVLYMWCWELDCPECGAVMKFQIKDSEGCLVIWDEQKV